MFLGHTHLFFMHLDKDECQFLHYHLTDQPILNISTLNMDCNVLVVWKISSKVNNIRSEQFQYSEKYIVLVFIIYLNIELLHVAYSIRYFFQNRAETFN